MTLFSCVLKGKTTSEDQFARFLKSYSRALQCCSPETIHVKTYFFLNSDTAEKAVKGVMKGEDYVILRRDDDPGELRNEFLARMQIIEGRSEDRGMEYFTFFDGDDEVSRNYFCQNYGQIQGRGFAIGNPIAVYGEDETDQYPLKWCTVASRGEIQDSIFLDALGCQSWGKFYEMEVAKYCSFGKGLFEDVVFTYQLVSKWKDPVLFFDAEYRWYRNNMNALTRTSNTLAQLEDGFNNLEYSKKISSKEYNIKDPRVFRRYTIGILVLLRNAQKVDNHEQLEEYIKDNIDVNCFNPEYIFRHELKFKENIYKDFPNIEGFLNSIK